MKRSRWLRVRSKQFFYRALALVYGFDRWHYRIVRENCGYFEKLRTLHDQLGAHVTIEVGCGLGEMIAALHSEVRVGIDRDPAVIGAARLLRSSHVRFFSAADDPDIELCGDERHRVCLLFLNWFHSLPQEEITKTVAGYLRKFHPSHVIFDVIDQNAKDYRYRHSPSLLSQFGRIATIDSAGDRIRSLVVLEIERRAAA